MPQSLALTDKQHAGAGITILDQDGQPYAALPDGVAAVFESSDPTVAVVTNIDPMNIDIGSGKVGTATVKASVTWPDGTVKEDTISVSVGNSAPGSINFTVGTPVDE